jgi:CheY-like chemotaxis protein
MRSVSCQPREPEIPVAPLRILLAEDNRTNQMVTAGMLRSIGHSVQIVADGLQSTQVDTKNLDLILMDIQMPVMDGMEATRQIRAIERETGATRIPIIALTASAMHDLRQACFEVEMDGVITKPVSRAGLLNELAGVVSRQAL